MHKRWWWMHRLAFAIVVPFGLAALVAWAVAGRHAAETVGWAAVLAVYLLIAGFRTARQGRAIAFHYGWRPKIEPEDRERRRQQREQRRRAREVALSRYGTVVRGAPREQRQPDA